MREVVETCKELKIKFLTLFAFSSENWSRPAGEVTDLLGLFRLFVRRDLAELHANGVRVRMIGDREGLARDLVALIDEAEVLTRDNTGLTLVIAFNYGARNEIARAARKLAEEVASGALAPDDVNEASLGARLDTAALPDPDLVIRTSGEQRLSNFLLWQVAYAEFYFSELHWPDFDEAALDAAFASFAARDRRFGALSAKVAR